MQRFEPSIRPPFAAGRCPKGSERARSFRPHMREGFCRRNHDPPLKCSDSSRRSASLSLFGTSGGLIWGPLAASFGVSSLFLLLSSLFSPLSSLLPERAARCPKGLVPLWRLHCGTSGGLFGSLCSLLSSLFLLLSSLSALCPLVSLPLLPQIQRRTCPLRSSHQATDVAPNSLDPLRLPPWPGGMREAIK